MDIFSNQPGAVTAVPSPGVPMAMFLENWGGYLPFKSIITGFEVQTMAGVQFMHSLRDFIYVYVFGERIAPVTISGVSMAHVCERIDERIGLPGLPAGRTTFVPNFHGLEYVMYYYNLNRVSSTGAPVGIVLGLDTVLFGFLTGVKVGLTDPERRLASFSLQFQAIPQASLLDLR